MPLRADRIATLCFFQPLRRLLGLGRPGIPILMYHSISQATETGRGAYFQTRTDPAVFREQLRFLTQAGYRAVSLQEAVRQIAVPTAEPEKLVALTFDDGYADFYTEAFPILSACQYTATVFLPTAYIGATARCFNGTPCLTWSQARELQHAGIDFGTHTVTHPQLRTLPLDAIQRELAASKQETEDRLGVEVTSFSYPYAFPETDRVFTQRLRGLLVEAGYRDGVSTIIGRANSRSDRYFLERLPMNSGDDARLLGAKLEGGYDWLHAFQHATKAWKSATW